MQVFKRNDVLAVELPRRLVDELDLKEGDELTVISVRKEEAGIESSEERKRRAIQNMRARQWTLPSDYKFDRDEANAR
ncbi:MULTISPECIES: AbrB family transcriptional regulator [unclassified Bradyrhizobium]|uniref:AbrB family transcriptional regulator n=1 Tax=unclassified Bradyrhizobium TaxID=2631580 RepID=UPI0028E6F673|nr:MULTISPECIES: AbrB family transcriptional regulator [unclassified Bradyrhizobium]